MLVEYAVSALRKETIYSFLLDINPARSFSSRTDDFHAAVIFKHEGSAEATRNFSDVIVVAAQSLPLMLLRPSVLLLPVATTLVPPA